MIQKKLKDIYGKHNAPYTIWHYAGALHRLQGYMGKREEKAKKLRPLVVNTLAWICAVGNHYEVDVMDNLYTHFPGVCCYCKGETCKCGRVKKKRIQFVTRTSPERSFGYLARMLGVIYPKNTLSKSIKKLGEEIGELPYAYCKKRGRRAFLEELADVTAWTLSVARLIGIGDKLDKMLQKEFGAGCPSCHRKKCRCRHFIEPI